MALSEESRKILIIIAWIIITLIFLFFLALSFGFFPPK